jgi:hypothetical protein
MSAETEIRRKSFIIKEFVETSGIRGISKIDVGIDFLRIAFSRGTVECNLSIYINNNELIQEEPLESIVMWNMANFDPSVALVAAELYKQVALLAIELRELFLNPKI